MNVESNTVGNGAVTINQWSHQMETSFQTQTCGTKLRRLHEPLPVLNARSAIQNVFLLHTNFVNCLWLVELFDFKCGLGIPIIQSSSNINWVTGGDSLVMNFRRFVSSLRSPTKTSKRCRIGFETSFLNSLQPCIFTLSDEFENQCCYHDNFLEWESGWHENIS